jgi:hypothetical protein
MKIWTIVVAGVMAFMVAGSTMAVAQDDAETGYDLHIIVRNCATELVEFFTRPQEGCVPGDGAFFNVTSSDGAFLGNCEATGSNPNRVFAGCIVRVPSGSTVVVTEDLASLPEGYMPETNPVTLTAPVGPVDGEDYGAIFINVLQSGSIPTDLPNTGAGPAPTGADTMPLVPALSAVAALLGLAGRRIRHQP